jgi:pathogenesis-related protein 1
VKRISLLIFVLTFSLSAWAADQLHNQYFNEGNIKFSNNDYHGALLDLNRSIEQNPGDTIAILMRAACKGRVGDWDGALADAENAVRLAESSGDENLPQYKTILTQVKEGKAKNAGAVAQSVSSYAEEPAKPVQSSRSQNGVVVNPAEMVAAHNRWRAQVGVPDIAYSDTLAVSAQAWVDNLKDTNQCKMRHSNGNLGENLFWAGAWSNGPMQDVSSTQVVDAWGKEKQNYNYADNSCASGAVCGHYTQVVWKNSTSVGCGVAVCRDNTQVWACQYAPAGNYVGQKPY